MTRLHECLQLFNGQLGYVRRWRFVGRLLAPGAAHLTLVDPHIGVAPNGAGRGGGRGTASASRGYGLGRDSRRIGQPDVFDMAEPIVLVRNGHFNVQVEDLERSTASVPPCRASSSLRVGALAAQVHESRT